MTLIKMGFKFHSLQMGKIYRLEMVRVTGHRKFKETENKGWIRIYKNDPNKSFIPDTTNREPGLLAAVIIAQF